MQEFKPYRISAIFSGSLWREFLASNHDYPGGLLDLGCETGGFARYFNEQGVQFDGVGIDISPDMAQNAVIHGLYKRARVGPIEELLMVRCTCIKFQHFRPHTLFAQGAGEYDHIVCFELPALVETVYINVVLARTFMLARKPITVEIEEVPEGNAQAMKQENEVVLNVNNIRAVDIYCGSKREETCPTRVSKFLVRMPVPSSCQSIQAGI